MHETPRILILDSVEKPHSTDLNNAFVAALNAQLGEEAKVEWHSYRELRIEISTGRLKVYIQSTGESLDCYRFVYFKTFFRYSEQATSIASYLDSVGIPFDCTELRQYLPFTKLTQYARLALAGMPIPETVYLDVQLFYDRFEHVKEILGAPFIFKAIDGNNGRRNYLVHTEEELRNALSENSDQYFIAQRFIENDSDLRILVVGKQVQLVINRTRNENSHLNNTSQGGTAGLLPVSDLADEHQALALQAAALMNREVAGVDLMFETGTHNPYLLEVNASPQIASGSFKEEKLTVISNYLKNMLK